jgi:catechol 2,3-dioxygenase-like lactoylglutathione lyase family enzyme
MTGPLSGPIRQIGYVVRDLDATIAQWVAMGIGPFYVVRNHTQQVNYRGQVIEVTLSIAFANSGDMQVELIHQHGDTPSIFTEFLADRGEGFHQFAWWVTDFDDVVAAAEAAGWPVVWSGGEDTATRFAYVEPPAGSPATIFELMELTEATEGMGAFFREASRDWDGTDPIRTVGA